MPDLRKYAAQTQNRLIIGLFALLFTIGLGLIWVFYGSNAALLGLVCLLGGVLLVLVIVLVLYIIERLTKNA